MSKMTLYDERRLIIRSTFHELSEEERSKVLSDLLLDHENWRVAERQNTDHEERLR